MDFIENQEKFLEYSDIKVDELDLSTVVRNALRYAGVLTLGDLLQVEYKDILMFRNMGKSRIDELRNYVHSLGLSLLHEVPSIEEKRKELREKNEKMLEEYGFSHNLCLTLYKHGIFTLDDVISYGSKINWLSGMGKVKQTELSNKIVELGVCFKRSPDVKEGLGVSSPQLSPNSDDLKKLSLGNNYIRMRVLKKEELVQKYLDLVQERRDLLEREKEIDLELLKLEKDIIEGNRNVKRKK